MTDFGVVLIGRNEGERLRRCLESVLKLTNRVAYADSASSDGSVELARSMGVTVVELDASKPLNAARGRNAGFEALQKAHPDCRFVQFLDGDCRLVESWPAAAIDFLQAHEKVAVVCGRRFEAFPDASFYNRLADEEWNTPVGRADACGGDAMMRVEAVREVGGYDGDLMACEEAEMTARMRERGWQIWRIDADMSEHDAAIFHFGQWWRRTLRSGFGYAQSYRRTQQLSKPVYGANLKSLFVWMVAIPLAIIAFAVLLGRPAILLALPPVYVLQVFRIARRRPSLTAYGLRASAMTMIAKVPELIGALQYFLKPRPRHAIEYKGN
jgi:GT2 family glycosyltransferase